MDSLVVTDSRGLVVVDFYNQINLLYGSITEFCSPQSCPEMKATDEYGLWCAGRNQTDAGGQVRIPLAGLGELQTTDQDVGSGVH